MENDENLDPNVWFNEPDTHIRCVVDVILKKKICQKFCWELLWNLQTTETKIWAISFIFSCVSFEIILL